MTIELNAYTLLGLLAVLAAYPPIFRQIRDVVVTTIAIGKVAKRYVDLPLTVNRVERLLHDHESDVRLHPNYEDHGGTT